MTINYLGDAAFTVDTKAKQFMKISEKQIYKVYNVVF